MDGYFEFSYFNSVVVIMVSFVGGLVVLVLRAWVFDDFVWWFVVCC